MTEESANLKSLLQKARELYQQGNLEASADCFQKLLAARETRAEAYYGLGLIEFSQKKYAEALDFFMTATQVDPHHANAYYYIGVIYEERKDLEEARSSYLKALSGNPNHRGAKEGMSRLGNKSVNNRFSPINSGTSSKSEFYELLSNDKSLAAQRALALIDELEFTVKPPMVVFFGGVLYRFALGVPLVLGQLIGCVVFLGIFLAALLIIGTIITTIMTDPWNPNLNLGMLNSFLGLLPILLPLFLIMLFVIATSVVSLILMLSYKSAQNTKYEFRKGLIKITKGAFAVSTETVEMYRIKGISVVQDWFSQRTGYATLVLTTDDSKQISLSGIAEIRRAYYLQDRLRELTVSLRSLPWIKGIIS